MTNNGPRSPAEIENSEHIDPLTTGDNIAAKKVALYVWDGVSSWARMTQPSGGGGSGGTQYQELATTSPATGTLALGRYQTSLPTLTTGQMNEPMLDSSSRLLVNVSNASLAVTQSGSWSVTANAGTNLNTSTLAVESGGNLAGINGKISTAAALTDSTANPTIGGVQVFPMGYNGSTWDRLHSNFLTADNQGVQTGLYTLPQNLIFNGTNWDRQRSYGGASAGSSTGIQANAIVGGLMPIGTKLNPYSIHLTTNTTTTPTAATAYISSVAISAEVGGTTSSVTIQDKSGTPLKLINGLATTAVSTVPTIVNFQTPVLMTGGIDIITAGAVAGTVDVWINYYQ